MEEPTARLVAQLDELGLDARVDPPGRGRNHLRQARLHVARGAATQEFTLLYGPDVRLTAVGPQWSEQPCFAYTPHIGAKTGDSFRRAGVQYLDAAGNAWIQFSDVLIDVRGRPRQAGTARVKAAGNLFSSGRAKVVLALLAWPRLWQAPQREVAHAAGVSLGQAHNTLALLAQAGYDRGRRSRGRTDLLDLWAAAFPTGLAQRLTIATYRGDVRPVTKVQTNDAVAASGEFAVPDLLRPATMTLYVAELDPRLAIVNRWRADGEPNIVIRRKFWNDPDLPDADTNGADTAPWPLIYADLLASDNPRAREAATQFRESHEQPR